MKIATFKPIKFKNTEQCLLILIPKMKSPEPKGVSPVMLSKAAKKTIYGLLRDVCDAATNTE